MAVQIRLRPFFPRFYLFQARWYAHAQVDIFLSPFNSYVAAIAQLGERQTGDLEVPGSIPGFGILTDLLVFRSFPQ